MVKSKTRRGKHIPQRTCVGCLQVGPKRTLIHIVRTPTGVFVEEDERLSGRGAYLHPQRSCWEKGLRSALANALRTNLSTEELARLQVHMETLPIGAEQSSVEKINI